MWQLETQLRLVFNWRTFSRRVTARWWRQWAKNQVWSNQNSRKRRRQMVRRTIWKCLPNYIMNDATTWFLAWNLLVYFFSLKHLLTQFYLYWFTILVLLTNLISIIFFFETYKNCGLEMLCKNTPRSLAYKDSNNNKEPDRNFFTEHLRRLSGTGVYVLILQKF